MLALNNSADYVVLSPSIDDHLNRPHMPLGNANGTESVWNRTDVGQIDEVLTTTSFVCAVIMLIFCCVGVCGNLLSIYVYTRRTMTSSINVLLTGMSAVDLSVVVLAVPVFVLRGLNTVFNSDTVTHINSHNARFLYPFACIAQSSSVWLLTVITVERYIAVSHPFLARHVCTSSRARLGILLVLTAAIIYNIPRFLEYDVSYDNGTVSEVPWLRGSLLYYYVYYTGFFLLTHFLVPFSIITVLNSLAAIRISQAKQQRKLLTSQQQSEHKTTSMMIVVIILFLFCNTLPFVLNLVEAFDMQLFINDTSMVPAYLVLDISNTLVVINSSSTFIIYYNFSQKYKLLVLRLLRREELDSTALEFTTHTHSGSIHYRGLSQKSHDRTVANGVLIAEKSSGERRSTELRKVVAQDDSESPLITWLSHDRQVGSRLAQSNNNEWLPGATNGT